MIYPTLKEIFWNSGFKDEVTPNIAELTDCLNSRLEKLVKKKRLSDGSAEYMGELISELNKLYEAEGFEQGFHFAVRLFLEN